MWLNAWPMCPSATSAWPTAMHKILARPPGRFQGHQAHFSNEQDDLLVVADARTAADVNTARPVAGRDGTNPGLKERTWAVLANGFSSAASRPGAWHHQHGQPVGAALALEKIQRQRFEATPVVGHHQGQQMGGNTAKTVD